MTTATLDRLETAGLVAVLRGGFDPEEVVDIGRALLRGGIVCIEVTLNSHMALEAIALLSERLGDEALIGAGTVMTPDDVDAAVDSGARFLVAPGLDERCIERARDHDAPFVPGVLTPTEVGRAMRMGCDLLKLFPAREVGSGYLAALRGPFPQARFMVTGGIGLPEIEPFHSAGAVAFGLGSSLVSERRRPEEIETLAARLVEELRRVRAADRGSA